MNWVKLLVDLLLAAVTVLTGAGLVVPLWGLALVLRSVRRRTLASV